MMMRGVLDNRMVPIAAGDLARLMPMFVWVTACGRIRAVGPTLAKLGPEIGFHEAPFLSLFEIRKPHPVQTIAGLGALAGRRLQVVLKGPPRTALRGIAVPLAEGQGMLLNLSFGISVADAVRDHALTNADFAPTDLTVELLYLREAKEAVMDELAALNRRLDCARHAAEAEAVTDPLTGLTNRRGLEMAFARLLAGHGRNRRVPDFALLHLDLDYFKSVNDTLGHAAGDLVLGEVAHILRAATRRGDTVARVGGDEFVLLLPEVADPEIILRTSRRIISELEQPMMYGEEPCRISGSIGATYSRLYDRPDGERMHADADTALYASKRAGRRRATLYSDDLALPPPEVTR